MNRIELKELIREIVIQEFQLEKSIRTKIDEFGELNDRIDQLKYELNKLTKEYKYIEDELRPILEQLKKHGEESLMTDKYLVSIKMSGYDRLNYRYKEVFEESLTKVNKSTRDLLNNLLKSTESITRVVSKVGVQPIEESGFLDRVFGTIMGIIRRVIPSIRRNTKDLSNLNKVIKKGMLRV